MAPSAREQLPMAMQRSTFYRENVLGTSFELQVSSVRAEDATLCEQQVLAEIGRLNLLLSIYEPASEISRVRTGAPVTSPELGELLSAYELWSQRTGGVINANMAGVISLWKGAQEIPPVEPALATAFAQPGAYNVDALGKGYIIDRAVAVAKKFAPGGLLNIGGDIRVWGEDAWRIGVADPFAPAENAPLLGSFQLRNGAVATSGGYARFVSLGGKNFSHIIDPRTLQPANGLASATIVAADCLTANALSTAANILGLGAAADLAKQFGAWNYLLVDAQGQKENSFALTTIADTATPAAGENKSSSSTSAKDPAPPKLKVAPADGPAWPTNFQVKVNLNLKAPAGGRAKRPYVAVWVEDADKNIVRTITVWGNEWKYLREMDSWWKASDYYADNFTQSITRATRAPGAYSVVWDGLSDLKKPVPQGAYKIFVEINREHGSHGVTASVIQCGAETASAELKATAELDAGKVEFGPKIP